MPASMNNAASNVIDLSSDDEESFQENSSMGRQLESSTERTVLKNENSQHLGNSQIEQSMCIQKVENPAFLRSRSHDFDWYLQDAKPHVQHVLQSTLSSTTTSSLQGERRLEQNGGRQANGVTLPIPASLSHQEGSRQQGLTARENHGSGQTLQVRQGEHISPVSSSRPSGLGQTVQQIENNTLLLQTSQSSQATHKNTTGIESMPTVNSSRPNQSESVPPKSSFHQFWKAGDYDVRNTSIRSVPGGMDHVRVHPKFLHSNATSHKWAFGAIAELLDNAVDEILHGATYVKVDQIYNQRDYSHALLVQDDGGGMDPECIRQCMSLGYSMKNTNATIGQYGNGFKTSTMRLGADVIVFTRTARGSSSTQSIGLLSYTFLRKTDQDDVIVPMVDFELPIGPGKPRILVRNGRDIWTKNLATIMQWSPFATESELMKQFDDIGPHGTKLIIYNLWLNDDGILELDFDSDKDDIKLRSERGGIKPNIRINSQKELLQSHISYRMQYSLRAYSSILYLRRPSNFKIILRGKPVEHHSIANDLKFSKVITYKPQLGPGMKEVVVSTTIGFTKEAPFVSVHGFNVYHKNRLIMPFWKVWQDNSSRGRGVVGVLEANFIEPAHDKQDFERTAVLLRLEAKLKQMTLDYWKANCGLVGYQSSRPKSENKQSDLPSVPNPQPLASNNPKINLPSMQNPCPLARIVSGVSPQQISSRLDMPVSATPATSVQTAPSGRELQPVAETSSNLVEKVSEENIQLFMRCEHHRQRDMELKQTIRKLENELNNAKQKFAQLVSNVESKKKWKPDAFRDVQRNS